MIVLFTTNLNLVAQRVLFICFLTYIFSIKHDIQLKKNVSLKNNRSFLFSGALLSLNISNGAQELILRFHTFIAEETVRI